MKIPFVVAIVGVLGMLLLPAHSGASEATGNVRMGTLFTQATGGHLNCTANDVNISKAISVNPTTCQAGTLFDFTATFQVQLSGGGSQKERYDLGLYFDITGDPEHDGALTGTCSVVTPEPGDSGYFQLDPHRTSAAISTQHIILCTRPLRFTMFCVRRGQTVS